MERHRPLISVCFCAGLLGGLVYALLFWSIGASGVPQWAGVRLTADLNTSWLYQHLVWGGIWGLLFFVSVAPSHARRGWIRKGLVIGFFPALIQLFYVFPYQTSHGVAGTGLGQLTFIFIFLYCLIWGAATGFFCRLLWGKR